MKVPVFKLKKESKINSGASSLPPVPLIGLYFTYKADPTCYRITSVSVDQYRIVWYDGENPIQRSTPMQMESWKIGVNSGDYKPVKESDIPEKFRVNIN